MVTQEAIPFAGDALGIVEDESGEVIGINGRPFMGRLGSLDGLPADDSEGTGNEEIHAGAGTGETLYSRSDALGTTMAAVNRSRTKITRDGKPISPFMMLWRLDTQQYVRVPTNQVVQCLNKRHPDTNAKVFALKGVDTRKRPFTCPAAADTGCPAKFEQRAQMLNHFKRRHPSLWEAQSAENENIQIDTQKAMIEQLREGQALMARSLEQQNAFQAKLLEQLLARGDTPVAPPPAPDTAATIDPTTPPVRNTKRPDILKAMPHKPNDVD